MNLKRSAAGLLGAVALLPAVVVGTGSAQAAPVASARLVAASPSVSPSVPTQYYRYETDMFGIPCPSGSLCISVDDPGAQKWKVFYFDPCRRYSVSNWEGGGYYINNQTGRVTTTFFDRWGNGFPNIPVGAKGSFNWSDVWSLQNC
ncbi:hypothetical protein ACIGZJ_36315 [Kitasatospora sp. NPDC052868]|uniref:hypothetical protein n=1 Tax=Kitasatospora sp. NPDC052868 TaxID=3364060 RepID=UPI0037C81693